MGHRNPCVNTLSTWFWCWSLGTPVLKEREVHTLWSTRVEQRFSNSAESLNHLRRSETLQVVRNPYQSTPRLAVEGTLMIDAGQPHLQLLRRMWATPAGVSGGMGKWELSGISTDTWVRAVVLHYHATVLITDTFSFEAEFSKWGYWTSGIPWNHFKGSWMSKLFITILRCYLAFSIVLTLV